MSSSTYIVLGVALMGTTGSYLSRYYLIERFGRRSFTSPVRVVLMMSSWLIFGIGLVLVCIGVLEGGLTATMEIVKRVNLLFLFPVTALVLLCVVEGLVIRYGKFEGRVSREHQIEMRLNRIFKYLGLMVLLVLLAVLMAAVMTG